MKKLLFIAAFAICGLGTSSAQGFSGGVNVGLPIGNSADLYSFSAGVDVLYMFNADEDFTYGVATGLQYYFGKTVNGFKVPNGDFIPLALAGRYAISDKFSLGADVGYAISSNGGFYYRPMVTYGLSDTMDLNLSYSGVALSGGTVSNVGVGIMYDF